MYAHAVRTLLRKGRGKKRCLLLTEPGNTAKTFMLLPLKVVFPETFSSPAGSKFSWLGAEESSIIFLNDYRWYPVPHGNIEWSAFLHLLEGLHAKLPSPKNHFVNDTSSKTIFSVLMRRREKDTEETKKNTGKGIGLGLLADPA